MRNWKDIIKEEPVALVGFIAAVVNVFLALGIEVSGDLVASINVLIGAAFMLVRWLVFSPATVDKVIETTKALTKEKVLSDIEDLAEDQRRKRRASGAKKAQDSAK